MMSSENATSYFPSVVINVNGVALP